MIKRTSIFIFTVLHIVFGCVYAQGTDESAQEKDWGQLELKPFIAPVLLPAGVNKLIKAVSVSWLERKGGEHGGDIFMSESYLIVYYQHRGYTNIEDRFMGHTPSVKFQDINGDGKVEMLIYYHAGGNQYCLRLYYFDDKGKILLYEKQPCASNLRSIEIKDGFIVVENQEEYSLIIDRYRLTEKGAELVETTRKRIQGGEEA